MGTYTFNYTPDSPDAAHVTVVFDDHNGEHPFIENVLQAFEQFMLGVTYQPGSIRKYLRTEEVQNALLQYAELARK
jgi:hypothetical protein